MRDARFCTLSPLEETIWFPEAGTPLKTAKFSVVLVDYYAPFHTPTCLQVLSRTTADHFQSCHQCYRWVLINFYIYKTTANTIIKSFTEPAKSTFD